MTTNISSNCYTIWFCRDKAADMIGYDHASRFVNKKYDPELFIEASNLDATLFSSIEEAEKIALDFVKKLFVYDHTKRPKVMTDFRVYRWWILDTTNPDFKSYYDKKNAIVKKGKADFTKYEDPSGGKLSKKIADGKAKFEASLDARFDYVNKLIHIPTAFVDKPETLHYGSVKPIVPMDAISWYHQFDPTFYRDSLNLPNEFSIIVPAKGFFIADRYDNIYNPDNTAIGRGFVLIHCQINFNRRFTDDLQKRSYYSNTLIGVFKTVESASIYSNLNGWRQPMVFKTREENLLCNYICSKYSNMSPATIYRLMVESGLHEPIAKFNAKNCETLKKTA